VFLELVKQEEQSEQRWRAEKQKCKEMETIIQNMDDEMQDLRAEKENLHQVCIVCSSLSLAGKQCVFLK